VPRRKPPDFRSCKDASPLSFQKPDCLVKRLHNIEQFVER
jgi:hypothetical protein